jgi:hypothetical protein
MKDTPRTDEEQTACGNSGGLVSATFARQLERELATARADYYECAKRLSISVEYAEKLSRAAERALHWEIAEGAWSLEQPERDALRALLAQGHPGSGDPAAANGIHLSKNTSSPNPAGDTPYRSDAESGKQTDEGVKGPAVLGVGNAEPSPDACCTAIENALRCYRCTYTREGEAHEESGLALVDVLTPPGDGSIERGIKELELLAEHLFDMLPPFAPFTPLAVPSQVNSMEKP